jgi:DNA-binding NarL/FixJ family response regulator
VLIGDFGGIANLGLEESLAEAGFDVVAERITNQNMIRRITEVRPDVVLIDLDSGGGLEAADEIASHFPTMKVIACSSHQPTMQVFPPFHNGESYFVDLDLHLLAEEIDS